jgi:hypothetical protein
MRLIIVLFGLILMFSGPNLGEIFQCYWTVYQAGGGGWSSIICESPAWVELRFIAPFQIAGALICILGIWLKKAQREGTSRNW